MFSRLMTHALLAGTLAAGLAVAHAQESPVASGDGSPSPRGLDLTLHFPRQASLAAKGTVSDLGAPMNLHGAASVRSDGSVEYRLAPNVELLAGYDSGAAFDALDTKSRIRDYAVGLKLEF